MKITWIHVYIEFLQLRSERHWQNSQFIRSCLVVDLSGVWSFFIENDRLKLSHKSITDVNEKKQVHFIMIQHVATLKNHTEQ